VEWYIYVATGAFWCLSLIGVYCAVRISDRLRKQDVETKAKEILYRADLEFESKLREADLKIKEQIIQQKEKFDKEQLQFRQKIHEKERQIEKLQDGIEKRAEDIRKRENLVESTQLRLKERISEADRKQEEIAHILKKERATLHELSGLSQKDAIHRLLKTLESELRTEEGVIILRHEKSLQDKCEQLSRNILLVALQRYAAAHTIEATSSTIDIPNDEMKGRIIGREGRNIRAFEKATGIDVIIDDTPGVVIVSGFDPIRREIARLALDRLITDGRIHPSRIEEIVAETSNEMQTFIQETGENACQELGIFGLNERLVFLLGRLHFRTSYSQNVLRHSIETAFLAGMIAIELGLNEKLARRCGLLHDIGKAIDHEIEGGHPKIGADLLRRYGEPVEVVSAALGHHDDPRVDHPYTVIVAAADACSASRPGARRESLESYVKRMEELESIATGCEGVEQAFAVQAGREMRVLVSATKTTDETAAKLCRDIVKTLSQQFQFPGEIKVTVIRETRCTEIAK